jgi:type VI secretion system protein ImpF
MPKFQWRIAKVAKSVSKTTYLPSLLDRLIDDDSINSSIQLQKKNLQNLENELAKLLSEKNPADPEASKKQRQQLLQELDQARSQFLSLSASMSSLHDARVCIKRDLDWLLNASQFAPQEQLSDYPEITRSVLNYGMPDFTGKTISGFDPIKIERLLKQVIINFEPRIIERTLVVRVIADRTMHDHNALAFEIEGELWTEPQPLHLHLRTEFQLEDGNVSVFDYQSVK